MSKDISTNLFILTERAEIAVLGRYIRVFVFYHVRIAPLLLDWWVWVRKVKNKKLATLVSSTQKRGTSSHWLRGLLGKRSFFNFISYKPSFLLHRHHQKTESTAPDLFLTSESLALNSRFHSSFKNYILFKYTLIDNNRQMCIYMQMKFFFYKGEADVGC